MVVRMRYKFSLGTGFNEQLPLRAGPALGTQADVRV